MASDCYGMYPSVPQLDYVTVLVTLQEFMCDATFGLCNKFVVIEMEPLPMLVEM